MLPISSWSYIIGGYLPDRNLRLVLPLWVILVIIISFYPRGWVALRSTDLAWPRSSSVCANIRPNRFGHCSSTWTTNSWHLTQSDGSGSLLSARMRTLISQLKSGTGPLWLWPEGYGTRSAEWPKLECRYLELEFRCYSTQQMTRQAI